MDCIAFVTDTHIGSDTTGFQQQPRRPDLIPACMDGLSGLLHQHRCAALLHGGDIIDSGSPQEIIEAGRIFSSLEIPTLCSLGNHDLGHSTSCDGWRMQQEPALRFADTVMHLNEADVIAVNTLWECDGAAGLYWEHRQGYRETIGAAQLQWLDEQLGAGEDKRPAIVMIHVGLDGLPTEVTGMAEVIHRPLGAYSAAIEDVLDRHPRVKLVLSGHSHVNFSVARGGRVHLTSTSLIEPPFEMRLIRVGRNSMEIETLPVIPSPENVVYLPEFAWVNGRPQDRVLKWSW